MSDSRTVLSPGTWCSRCGARPGVAGPAWICRVCIARSDRLPDHACIVRNDGRRPLPPGTPGARERYRAAGLCHGCGADRDRTDRKHCARCRRPRGAGTTARGARTRYRAAGLCVHCGADRDRTDRLCCARCRRRLKDASNRYRDAHPQAARQSHRDYLTARRRRYIAAGQCPECGRDRDRPDRKLCARCRRYAADKQRAHRMRRTAREDSPCGDSRPPAQQPKDGRIGRLCT